MSDSAGTATRGLIFDRTRPCEDCDSDEGCGMFEEITLDELIEHANTAESKLDLAAKALHAMANDGWMMHGVEGYSDAQQAMHDAMDVIGWPDGHTEPPK